MTLGTIALVVVGGYVVVWFIVAALSLGEYWDETSHATPLFKDAARRKAAARRFVRSPIWPFSFVLFFVRLIRNLHHDAFSGPEVSRDDDGV